ncbi:helix-turn-helix transcriptional regulator [Nocardia sp. NPDC006630]|uniref:helix-turn-helix domain-containing protein n=1 Tax=Nocardia sp. NPDC006630 TaxID=3157181 RepID=UPI0033A0436D
MSEQPRLHSIPGGRVDRTDAPRPHPVREPLARPGSRTAPPAAREPLWREVLGARLRTLRQDQGEKLTETAARAGISPQYLSEVERGRKEPSSEMIAALAGALGTTLADLTAQVAAALHRQSLALTSSSPQRMAVPASQRITGPVLLAA